MGFDLVLQAGFEPAKHYCEELVEHSGFEPLTNGLSVRHSTAELMFHIV